MHTKTTIATSLGLLQVQKERAQGAASTLAALGHLGYVTLEREVIQCIQSMLLLD